MSCELLWCLGLRFDIFICLVVNFGFVIVRYRSDTVRLIDEQQKMVSLCALNAYVRRFLFGWMLYCFVICLGWNSIKG